MSIAPRLAALTVLALAAPLAAQDRADVLAPSDELPDLGPIQEQLLDLRGLAFRKDVPASPQSLEDFGDFLDHELDKAMPEDKRPGLMRGLVRLGMLDEPIDLAGALRDAMLSQAGAYYDPADEVFYYLMTGLPTILMNTIAAHELVHALQDQHFDLDALMADAMGDPDAAVRNDDRASAMQFLVEGDATLTMTLHQFLLMKAEPGFADVAGTIRMQAGMSLDGFIAQSQSMGALLGEDSPLTAAMEAMDAIPRYILEPLMGAYVKGALFCLEVAQAGGWEALDAVYADLPVSTEQVLHPARYIAEERDMPTPMALPELAALRGHELLDGATHGELFLRVLLANLGLDDDTVRHAADGWDGDVYHAYDVDGDTLIVLATTWDSAADAYEFQEAYAEGLASKYPGFRPADADLAVADLRFACGEGLGHGALVLRGQEVFAVEGGSAERVDALVSELWDWTPQRVR